MNARALRLSPRGEYREVLVGARRHVDRVDVARAQEDEAHR